MNEDKIQRQINEMNYAAQLINNEFLWKQFDYLTNEYIERWKVMPAKDTDGRERLWQAINVVGLVKQHLQTVFDAGKLAKQDLDRMVSKKG